MTLHTGAINLRLPDGTLTHVHLGMECWSCDHLWWDCTNDENVACPRCGQLNWARTPIPLDATSTIGGR